jgi:hypothetical protein
MLRAVQKLFASLHQPRTRADDLHARHLAWDRACRARGMTASEQADELQLRCAWVRLRTKASAKVLKSPRRFRDILDRVAADEAKTLAAIGGGELAAVFLRAYEATEAMEILSPESVALVGARDRSRVGSLQSAPSMVPDLPSSKARRRKTSAAARVPV